MKMKARIANSLISILKKRLINFFMPAFFAFSTVFILSESLQAQGCLAILNINDPAPVCYPATVDLTLAAVTVGSTVGMKLSYYSDPNLTVLLTNPKEVTDGTYYIKGLLTDPRTVWVAGSVKVTVLKKPKLNVVSQIIINKNEKADLTSEVITKGSDIGLDFTYWNDYSATISLPSPSLTAKGNYFIKGTSLEGCFDIQLITVNEK